MGFPRSLDRNLTTDKRRTCDTLRDVSQLHHVALGDGMPVVMCHGFPGLAHSYRHQMRPIAEAGFRAVAVDMLGYGASASPVEVAAYTHAQVAAGLVRLLDELGAEQAVLVGHDFGAPAAWHVALRYPERVAGLVLLSVPYEPDRMPARPSSIFASIARKHFLHLHYFQAPSVAEAELDPRARDFLARLFFALSGDYHYLDVWKHPPGGGYLDALPEAPPLPWPWLTREDFEVYARTFERTGFGGGLRWYRAFDLDWELDAPYDGRPLTVPTLFIAGANDPVIAMRGEAGLARMRALVPDLRGLHVLPGAGHWVQQERADAVSALVVEFLRGL